MRHASVFLRNSPLVLLLIGHLLTACQRAPYATVQPQSRPTYRTPLPAAAPAEPELTASAAEAVPVTTLSARHGRNASAALPPPTVPSTADYYVATSTGPVSPPAGRSGAVGRVDQQPGSAKNRRILLPKAPPCDQIVLRNGDVVTAIIKEVGVNEIRYKRCDRPDGPDYTLLKRDILSIKYSNGEVERFTSTANPSSSSSSSGSRSYDSPTARADGPKTDPFAIVSISAAGAAILFGVGGLLLVAGAIVFGALSLKRIKTQPERFKGRGLALAGMITAIVIGGLIVLAIAL